MTETGGKVARSRSQDMRKGKTSRGPEMLSVREGSSVQRKRGRAQPMGTERSKAEINRSAATMEESVPGKTAGSPTREMASQMRDNLQERRKARPNAGSAINARERGADFGTRSSRKRVAKMSASKPDLPTKFTTWSKYSSLRPTHGE